MEKHKEQQLSGDGLRPPHGRPHNGLIILCFPRVFPHLDGICRTHCGNLHEFSVGYTQEGILAGDKTYHWGCGLEAACVWGVRA